jgi:hypothetical protein
MTTLSKVAIILSAGLSSVTHAAVIQNTVSVGPAPPEFPFADQWVSTERGAFFFTDLNAFIFQITDSMVAGGTAYFLVEENDPITWYTINFPAALASNTGLTPPNQQFIIPNGGSILLGFWEDADGSGSQPAGNYVTPADNFGWVRIQNIGGTLSSLGSAVADDGPGILAGTLTTVPEPGTAILALSGLLVLVRKRR